MNKNKKGAIEFSFTWIFAIIAGVFILFLAIFAVSKIINIERVSLGAETAKSIEVLLNPLESSFETGKRNLISSSIETRIYSGCISSGNFGNQTIKVSQKTYNEWSPPQINVGFQNRYIFSKEYVEGKNFYVYSKTFEFPFKVADLIYITSSKDSYCFVNAPERIKEEIQDLKAENLVMGNNCTEESLRICFRTGSDCDMLVSESEKSVKKGTDTLYFEGDALMYAAIFSDKELYECQLIRLIKRAEELSLIYRDKATLLFRQTGCETGLALDLEILNNYLGSFEDSGDLSIINTKVTEIKIKNENSAECRLW